MHNPVPGYVSSEWARVRRNPASGVVTSHAGIDIAGPVGTLVRAAFAGRVISVFTDSYPGDKRYHYGPKTGNHVTIENDDGAVQYYGHLHTSGEWVGDWVEEGEIIGTRGQTGNVTGPHLHFECWSNDNMNSHFNPRILFKKYGITPGVDSTITPVSSVTPITKDWFEMATKTELVEALTELIPDIAYAVWAYDQKGEKSQAWAYLQNPGYDVIREPLKNKNGKEFQQAAYIINDNANIWEIRSIVMKLAEKVGLSEEEIKKAVSEALTESVVQVDVNVGGKKA